MYENRTRPPGGRERRGLDGPNDAGKPTLMRLVAGQEPPGSGERRCQSRVRMVVVDQDSQPNPEHTVLEEIYAGSG